MLSNDARSPAMRTDTTRPYTAIIPAITTGTKDWVLSQGLIGKRIRTVKLAFIIRSGLNDPRPAIPIPAFDVPNAAPTAVTEKQDRWDSCGVCRKLTAHYHLDNRECTLVGVATVLVTTGELTAEATPANPKKGAYGGQDDMIIATCRDGCFELKGDIIDGIQKRTCLLI